jgi:hypothetical protein
MLIKDLIEELEGCDPESEVKLWDRVNGKYHDIQHVDIQEESIDLVYFGKKQ